MIGVVTIINIKEELEKYEEIDLEDIYQEETSEINMCLKEFTKAFDRVGKEQYKSNNQINDMIDMLEEEKLNNIKGIEIREKTRIKEEENLRLLKGIINVCDLMEDIYLYSEKFGDNLWKEQIKLQWSNLEKILSKQSISRIGDLNETFEPDFHRAIEIKSIPDVDNNIIIEVIKSGYIYYGKVIRKADVVINNR